MNMEDLDVSDPSPDPAAEERTLTCGDVLQFFKGGRYIPLTGMNKVHIQFHSTQKFPSVSTCALTAVFPANYKVKTGAITTFPLRLKRSHKSKRSAAEIYSKWVVDSPGYGCV